MSCAMFGEFSNAFCDVFSSNMYGIMCGKTCSHGVEVDFKVSVIIRSVVLNY
jgi:hypothetical protein